MQAPPPYYSSQPKKNRTGLIVGLIIGGVVLCCVVPIAFLGGVGIWGVKKMQGAMTCAATFQAAGRSVIAYEADHDGKLPDGKKWQDEIEKYYDKEVQTPQYQAPFKPPATTEEFSCSDENNQVTGFAFNSDVSGKKASDIKDQLHTVVIYELAKTGKNISQPYKSADSSQSPKIMTIHRGWFVYTINDKLMANQNGKLAEVHVGQPDMFTGDLTSAK
jgi:hypothetical protein